MFPGLLLTFENSSSLSRKKPHSLSSYTPFCLSAFQVLETTDLLSMAIDVPKLDYKISEILVNLRDGVLGESPSLTPGKPLFTSTFSQALLRGNGLCNRHLNPKATLALPRKPSWPRMHRACLSTGKVGTAKGCK